MKDAAIMKLERICEARIRELNLTDAARERMNEEFKTIENTGLSTLLLCLYDSITPIRVNRVPMSLRHCGGSSLINYLLGFSKYSPLHLCSPAIFFFGEVPPSLRINLPDKWRVLIATDILRRLKYPLTDDVLSILEDCSVIDIHVSKDKQSSSCFQVEDKTDWGKRVSLYVKIEHGDLDIVIYKHRDIQSIYEFSCRTGALPPIHPEEEHGILNAIEETPISIGILSSHYIRKYILPHTTVCSLNDVIHVIGLSLAFGEFADEERRQLEQGKAVINNLYTCREELFEDLLAAGLSGEDAYHLIKQSGKDTIEKAKLLEKLKKAGIKSDLLRIFNDPVFFFSASSLSEAAWVCLTQYYYFVRYPELFHSSQIIE